MVAQELAAIWQIKCVFKVLNRLSNAILTFVLISASLMLVGCGGGGGSDSISTSTSEANGNASLESSNEDTAAEQQSTSSLESVPVVDEQPPVNGSQIFPLADVNRTATLSWTLPTKRSDGSDLQLHEIDAFYIYHKTEDGSFEEKHEVNGDEVMLKLYELQEGKHLFTITVIDINGLESDFSETVAKVIL